MKSNNWNPENYHATADTRVILAFDTINRCSYHFRGDESILDIGCGNGAVTAALKTKVPHGNIVGLDLAPEMLSFAKKNFHSKNLNYVLGDAKKLSFSDEFDLITSFSALHWIDDQVTVLKGIELALKPQGQAILMYNPRNKILWKALSILIQNKNWQKYFIGFVDSYNDWNVPEYRKFIEHTNLEVLLIEEIERCVPNATKEWFTTLLKSWLHYLKVIPVELRDQFMNELMYQIEALFQQYSITSFANWSYSKTIVNLVKK